MSYAETVELGIDAAEAAPSSGAWSVPSRYEPRVSKGLGASLAAASLLVCGSATAFEENLRNAEQLRAASTVARELEPTVGRRVSRAEALLVARRTLERAERERLALAENEARRSAQLDE